jgi:hypothetical protein
LKPTVLRVAITLLLLSVGQATLQAQLPDRNRIASKQQETRSGDITVVTTDPNLLVLASIRQAVWGPPIACKVQQSTKAFGQQCIVVGDFKSMGQGTGQFRYSVRVTVGETAFDLLQVSDGELMWTQGGMDEPPRKVNLRQVRESVS